MRNSKSFKNFLIKGTFRNKENKTKVNNLIKIQINQGIINLNKLKKQIKRK